MHVCMYVCVYVCIVLIRWMVRQIGGPSPWTVKSQQFDLVKLKIWNGAIMISTCKTINAILININTNYTEIGIDVRI